jgi:hypothetical protein
VKCSDSSTEGLADSKRVIGTAWIELHSAGEGIKRLPFDPGAKHEWASLGDARLGVTNDIVSTGGELLAPHLPLRLQRCSIRRPVVAEYQLQPALLHKERVVEKPTPEVAEGVVGVVAEGEHLRAGCHFFVLRDRGMVSDLGEALARKKQPIGGSSCAGPLAMRSYG